MSNLPTGEAWASVQLQSPSLARIIASASASKQVTGATECTASDLISMYMNPVDVLNLAEIAICRALESDRVTDQSGDDAANTHAATMKRLCHRRPRMTYLNGN